MRKTFSLTSFLGKLKNLLPSVLCVFFTLAPTFGMAAFNSSARVNATEFEHTAEHDMIPTYVQVKFDVYSVGDESVQVKFEWYKPNKVLSHINEESYVFPPPKPSEPVQTRSFNAGFYFQMPQDSQTSSAGILLGDWSLKTSFNVDSSGWELVNEETLRVYTEEPDRYQYQEYLSDGVDYFHPYLPINGPTNTFYTSQAKSGKMVTASINFDYYYQEPAIGVAFVWYPLTENEQGLIEKSESYYGEPQFTWTNDPEYDGIPDVLYALWSQAPIQWLVEDKLVGIWEVEILIDDLSDSDDYRIDKMLYFELIDDVPPVIQEVNYPLEKVEMSVISIDGYADDDIDVVKITWSNDLGDSGEIIDYGITDWAIPNIELASGLNVITVNAYDEANNEGTDIIPVFFDNSPPELMAGGLPISVVGKLYTLEAYATDKNSNLRDISIAWGDGSFEKISVPGNEAYAIFQHIYQSEGIFTATITASDKENESSTVYQSVLVISEEDNELARKLLNCDGLAYDPIDLSTGAQLLQHTLLTTQGVLPLSFELGYYSLLLKEGSAGRGWEDKQFGAFLEELDNGDVKLHWTTNTYNIFPQDGNGGYQPLEVKCYFDRLVKNIDGNFTLTRKNGRVYQFNAQGRLEKIGNTQGQFVDLTYDGNGRLFQVTEPVSGVFLEYAYNASGLLESVTDTLGRQANLEYDDNKNLIKLTDAASQTTTYTYNEQGQTLTGINAEGLLLFSNTYDVTRRIIAQEDGVSGHQPAKFVYTLNPTTGKIRSTTITNRLGKTSIYTFDDNFQVISIEDELGNTTSYPYNEKCQRTSVTDGNGNTTSYTYDNNGNVKTITDALGNQTQLVYDGDNNLLSVTNALGKQIQFVYNDNNQLTRITDSLNNITSYTYNADGQVLTKTRPRGGVTFYVYEKGLPVRVISPEGTVNRLGYDAAGRLTTITDVDDNSTTLTYDGINRLTAITNPLGHTVSMTYDSRNNLLTFTDANGNVTHRGYDASDNLISQINALGDKTRYKYDGEGRLIRVTDAKNRITQLGYDKKGRLTSITNPLGHSQRLNYDAADNLLKRFDAFGKVVMSFDYDVLNNPIEMTDALSNSSTFKYDELSRLIQTADPLQRVTQFDYDDLNRLVSTIDALTGESSQGFDADGNKGNLTDPNNNNTRFDFDKSGRLVQETLATGEKVKYTYNTKDLLESVTNRRNQQRQFEYDADGQLSSRVDPDGSVSYTYDANGNVLTVTDANFTITREYDKLNRVTKYTDTRGNTLQHVYDEVGNLVTLTYPNGKQVHYEYNVVDQLIKVTDWTQRVTRYDYNKNGHLNTATRPNGTKMYRVYDTAGQLLRQFDIVTETGEVISQFDFEYDAVGNIIKEKATHEPDIAINLEMTYAVANRLATYDGSGVQLDADGNMTNGPLLGDMASFSFDSRNRLMSAGETVYHYDVENQRIGVNQTQYVINSQPVLSQVLVKTEADGTQTYYVYGLGLIGQEQDGEYLSYHFDLRGSTIALTDEIGQVVERFLYSSYGVLVSGDVSKTPFLFNGKYGVMNDTSGLYYMRTRYYNPIIRRFMNQDVLLGNIVDGQGLNRYAFVTGQPINYVDPFGLEKCGRCAPDKDNDCLLYGYNECSSVDLSTSHFRMSLEEMLDKFADDIIDAGNAHNIDASAIAGAIAWEYENNLRGRYSDYFQYFLYDLIGGDGIGWGSIHTPKLRELHPELPLGNLFDRALEALPAIWSVGEIMEQAASRYYKKTGGICIHNIPEALAMFFNSSDKFLEDSAAKRKIDQCVAEPPPITLIVNQNDMGTWVKENIDRFSRYKTNPILPLGCNVRVNTQ